MKKIFILLLSFIVAVYSFAGCGFNGDNTNESSGNVSGSESGNSSGDHNNKDYNGEITFWSASTAETVLLKRDISLYSNIRNEARVNVEMAKNEYEGAQIFLTATEDVGEYFVEKSDLKTNDGKTFYASNIDVYAYKYVETTFNTATHRGIGIGYYPDAILPIDASVKFGENTIKKGDNQGIYVRFHTLPETDAGIYTGKITVRYDGKSKDIPITVKVWNVTVSETTRSKSLFSNDWNWASPELDSTEERYQSYIDLLSEYRIGSINLMQVDDRDKGNLDALAKTYADKVYEYAKNPRNSVYSISYYLSGDSFNKTIFEKFVIAIAEKSFETGFNCLDKAAAYFGALIDEATMQGKLDETILVTNDYRAVLQSSHDKIIENKALYIEQYGVSGNFVDELADSAASIPHIFVANYNENYSQYIDKDGTGTGHWCPNVWTFQDGEGNVDKLMEIGLDWWYGCSGSSRPIPSYQLDDYTLSPRIMSWQQIYYGIVGNLYWSTNINYTWGNGWYEEKEDYYSVTVGDASALGDGQLTYPGGQYELASPVATRRLEAIRDGLEEYELLLDLKNKYAEIASSKGLNFTFDKVYSFITSELFKGIEIIASADSFNSSRNLLFQLLSLANSAAELSVIDINITPTEISGKCFVKDGYTLKLNGNAITGKNVNGGKSYSFKVDLTDYNNSCILSVPELGEGNTLTIASEGKAEYYDAQSMFENFKKVNAEIEKTLENATFGGALSEKLVKINVSETASGKQSLEYTDANIKKLGKATSSMTLRIYNGSGSTRELTIMAKYKGDEVLSPIVYTNLQVGWNTVIIKGIDQKNWNDLISIDYIRFNFGKVNEIFPAISGLYFDGYYITYLSEVQ